MRRVAVERLGEILLHYKLISERALEEALEVQRREKGRLGEILVRMGHLTERELMWSLANQLDLPCVSTIEKRPDYVDEKVVRRLPRHLAYKHHVLPVVWNDDELTVVTDDPLNLSGFQEIEKATGLRLNVAAGPTSEILEALDALYGSIQKGRDGKTTPGTTDEPHPLATWLERARGAGYRRMVIDPGGRHGKPVVQFRGYPGESTEIPLDDYRNMIRALRRASGHKSILGPTLGPFRFRAYRGVVAFAHTRGGLAAAVNVVLPGEDVDWPATWHDAFRQELGTPGLWLVAVHGNQLWEPFTYFIQEAFADRGRVIAGGLVHDGPLFPRTTDVYSPESIAALFALEPEVILFPASARTALIEHLRAGRPGSTVMLQVAARNPVRALQVFQGYGVSGPETAEMVRGVLTVRGIPRRPTNGSRRAGSMAAVLGWHEIGPSAERHLAERAPIQDIVPLLDPGPIPPVVEQVRTLEAKGILTQTQGNALLRELIPSVAEAVDAGATVDAPEVCDGQY